MVFMLANCLRVEHYKFHFLTFFGGYDKWYNLNFAQDQMSKYIRFVQNKMKNFDLV